MREIILIRHGITPWNTERRIQVQTDIPLSPEGEAQVRRWRLPADLDGARWYASPLLRTRQTSSLLGVDQPQLAPEIMEMDWGEWTGCHLADLRRQHGEAMAANERRGIDFQPPGGESPRMVRTRLANWLDTLDGDGRAVVAITHKGVIRAAISHATGWDMVNDHDDKLKRNALHRFRLERGGQLVLDQLNEPI